MKIEEFIEEHNITIKNTKVRKNPNMSDFEGDHWESTLSMNNEKLTIYFSKGFGHNGKQPTVKEVLESMVLDVTGYINSRSFSDWCSEYGYNDDSIKAYKIYTAVMEEHKQLIDFFGSDLETLLWDVEFD